METSAAKFWSQVNKSGPIPECAPEIGNCWVWTGTIFHSGYGRFGNERAHRIAKALVGEPIPMTLDGLHKCDNKPCVRPSHIYAGTHDNNMYDAMRHGRILSGNRHPFVIDPSRAARGTHAGLAKLSDEKVIEMRRLRKETGASYSSIGKMFGVTSIAARQAIIGATWSHVPYPIR